LKFKFNKNYDKNHQKQEKNNNTTELKNKKQNQITLKIEKTRKIKKK